VILWALTAVQHVPGVAGEVSRAFAQSLEAEADAHACANSAPVVFSGKC
jgi:hypothetical protein